MKSIVYKILLLSIVSIALSSCESYLDRVTPDDKIKEEDFWKTNNDAVLAFNAVYQPLTNTAVYGYGGGMDACTPNAYQWAHWEGQQMQIGDGSIYSGSDGLVKNRWKFCYEGINRANYFLENVDKIPLSELKEAEKEAMKGEVYFLRAVYYDLLVRTYGGIPIVTKKLTINEARDIARSSLEDSWAHVHADFDEAIKRLLVAKPAAKGHATLGSAYGMKMKSYLYVGDWDNVLKYCDLIDGLNQYSLFSSYQGLFQYENEGNSESIFVVGFMSGPLKLGSVFDRYFQPQNTKHGINGSNSVAPIPNLVDAYQTKDNSAIDTSNPYANRDPRLDFTILRPGAYFQGQLYPTEIKNHTGQKVGFGFRKYTIETMDVIENESPLDFMVLRYADVLLCRAEAYLESSTHKDIPAAIDIINRIRTERTDVKMFTYDRSLSEADARKALRFERRIELALEGQYWDDIKRWKIGTETYPVAVIGADGETIQTKFAKGYNLSKDNLLPIPDSEISMNPKLVQNPNY